MGSSRRGLVPAIAGAASRTDAYHCTTIPVELARTAARDFQTTSHLPAYVQWKQPTHTI
jgi:hypothetical protein